jgi:hypothetical protein
MAFVQRAGRSIASRWKLWVPPLVLTLVVYILFVVLVSDTGMSMFAYKQF